MIPIDEHICFKCANSTHQLDKGFQNPTAGDMYPFPSVKTLQGSENVESLHRPPFQKFPPSMALVNRHEAPTVDRAFRAGKWGGPRFSVGRGSSCSRVCRREINPLTAGGVGCVTRGNTFWSARWMLKGVLGGGSLLLDERLFFIAMLKEIYLGQNFRSLMTKLRRDQTWWKWYIIFSDFPPKKKQSWHLLWLGS